MRRAGGYLLERALHQGAKFRYWLARQERDGRRFLVSLVAPELLDDGEDRAKVLERLRDRAVIKHPRIPRLIEIIEDGDHLGAAYTFVPGVPVSAIMARSRAGLPPELAGRIVERLARIIHQARLSPRWCSIVGLEPKSVIIDPSGAPHLLLSPPVDGYTRVSGRNMTVTRMLCLSPEAIHGMPALPQSTVFSLGVLLYHLIVGRNPFSEAESAFQTLQRILEANAAPISDQIQIAPAIRAVLERAMRVDAEDRYVHPGVLADALHAALPPNLGERALLDYAAPFAVELQDPELEAQAEPAPPADHAEHDLIAAIRADTRAIDPYLVYADWLQSCGRPRGELIALQHQGLEAESERFLLSHPELLGDLAPLLAGARAVQGLEPIPSFDAGPHFVGTLAYAPLAVRWHLGFIASLRIALDEHSLARGRLERVMRWLDDLETAQFLSELTIGTVSERNPTLIDDAYEALSRSRLELETLYLGDLGAHHPRTIHRATANISSACPNLRRLAIRGGEIQLGRMLLPELRELRIYSGGLTAETLTDIAGSALPKLEHLELGFGGAPSRSAWPDRVGILFEERHLPSLKSLALGDREPNAIAATLAVLAESDLAPRLERLDVRSSATTEAVVQAVLRNRDRFPKLIDLLY